MVGCVTSNSWLDFDGDPRNDVGSGSGATAARDRGNPGKCKNFAYNFTKNDNAYELPWWMFAASECSMYFFVTYFVQPVDMA